jgi:uncharacterized membrane protein
MPKSRKNALTRKRNAHDSFSQNNDKTSHQTIATYSNFYHGPLPSPEILHEYNKLFPGLAERIITMAESEIQHRQLLEKQYYDEFWKDQKSRRRLIFIHAICLCVVVAIAILLKEPIAASVMAALTITGSYLSNKQTKKLFVEKERSND